MTTPAASDGPADAFAALSDSNRVAILEALWEADGHEASFSDLRSAVGMRDSGQFNYHLGKLTDQFVRQTDDGTYALSVDGERGRRRYRAVWPTDWSGAPRDTESRVRV